MSTDKPDEALKRLLFEKAFMRHYTNGAHLLERFDTGHYRSEEARAAWQIACIFSASLAAHEAEQEQTAASELDRERAARREAQIELERYKSLLSRARIDLMRELREQGWVLQEQAGEAVAVCEFLPVRESAVKWLKDKYPALCEKAGLCERIGGRLYTVTHSSKYDRPPPKSAPLPAHEIVMMYAESPSSDAEMIEFARAIERAHGITKDTKTNVRDQRRTE